MAENKQQVEEKAPLTDVEINGQVQNRIDKMHKIEEHGWLPFGRRFEWTHRSADVKEQFDALAEAEAEVKMAGRVMAIRGHGKTCFMDMQDKTGRMQLYVRKDVLGEEDYSLVKMMDIGDTIGVTGIPFRTHMGEVSIKVVKMEMLSKSLRPLPEKWHGLKDIETRYRQRYVDLIVNPEVRDTFVKRSQIIRSVREVLDSHDFLEVETPILNTIAGGAAARPFISYHNALDMQVYMRIAPELYLKRLIVGGMDRVYELGRVFRNEGIDNRHNPEFTSVEIYQAFADYRDMMDLTEEVVVKTAMKVLGIGAIIGAIFLLALILTGRRKAEIDCLAELCRGLELIRAELGSRLTPMPELLGLLEDQCAGEAGNFFRTVGRALPLLEERDFSSLWSLAAEEALRCLSQRELDIVKKVGTVLGKYELSEQLNVIGSCLRELKAMEERLRVAYPQSRKLFFGISAAAGGFIIILLL